MAETRNKNLIKALSNALVNGKITTAGVLVPDIVEDTTPQLGGNLDVNGSDIVSTSDGNIDILPNGAGKVNLDGNGSTGGITVSDGLIEMRTGTGSVASIDMYCEVSNAHKVTLKPPPHADYSGNVTFQLPSSNGTSGYVLQTNGSGITSWVETNLAGDTSPQLGGNLDLNSNNITGTGNISTTGTISLTNTTTDDTLLLTTTEDSSTAAPVFTFKRNSGSPADGDYLGQLKFKGENDADQEVVYAKITGKISDVTDTTEDGLIEFTLRKAGSNNIGARLTSTELKLINGTGLEVAGLTYPTADGSADQVLTTNGSGTLSFADAAGSAATPYQYTATAGQTTFSGSDANGNTLAYDSGKTLVYQNGVLLTPVDDYTATSGSTVILQTGADVNDVIIIAALGTAQATVNSASTTNVLYEHSNSISSAYSISSGNNALSAGPITVETGGSVLVPTGSSWVVV